MMMSCVSIPSSIPKSRPSISLGLGTPKLFNSVSVRVAVNVNGRGRNKGLSCNAMFDLGVPKLVVIVGVPKKLPEVERSIDKTVKSFQ